MNEDLTRLRKLSAESQDEGCPATRDKLMLRFLSELSTVVGSEVVGALDDGRLRSAYYHWSEAVIAGADEAQRISWLSTAVYFSVTPYVEVVAEELPENVVQFRR